jgi:hypothetical protein
VQSTNITLHLIALNSPYYTAMMPFTLLMNFTSLFCLSVAAIDAKKCYVTGRGVQLNGIRVGDVAEFTVHTDGAGDGELKVTCEAPGGKEEPIRVKKVCLNNTVQQ